MEAHTSSLKLYWEKQTKQQPQLTQPTIQTSIPTTKSHQALNWQLVKKPVEVFSGCSDPKHNIQNDRIETYLKNARVAQADTSLSYAALEQAKIRQVAQAWSS